MSKPVLVAISSTDKPEGGKQPGGHAEAVVVQIFCEPHIHVVLKEFHKVGFAVKSKGGHIRYRDRIGIVFFNIFQNRF